jgi:hypothetical protein
MAVWSAPLVLGFIMLMVVLLARLALMCLLDVTSARALGVNVKGEVRRWHRVGSSSQG